MDVLDEGEIDEVLRGTGYGFLGLALNNRPYVIPMSFGYDGDAIYFQMNSHGRKFEYIENNPVASFTVVGLDEATGISKSVILEGEVAPVLEDGEENALEALVANAEFSIDIDVWGDPIEEVDLMLLMLRPITVAGRVFGEKLI